MSSRLEAREESPVARAQFEFNAPSSVRIHDRAHVLEATGIATYRDDVKFLFLFGMKSLTV